MMPAPIRTPAWIIVAMLATALIGSPGLVHGAKTGPAQVVILGGSITAHPANFGKFLSFGCRNLKVHNLGKARLKASHLLRRLDSHVLQDEALMASLKEQRPWLLYLGGLNGIYRPERTRKNIAATFAKAHGAGFRIMALTLTPWGAATDRRWRAYEGLHKMRSTELVNDFLRGRDRTGWPKERRPDLTVETFDSVLRQRRAALRPRAPLAKAFAKGRYGKRRSARKYIRAARRVPRNFMRMRYRGRYHFHPNWRGQRVMAGLVCDLAPAEWACDCKKIRRAWSKDRVIRGPR